jgi:hypothetical protein
MTSFAADWLARREPFDLRARNETVRDAVAAAFAGDTSIAVVDLACGTGATLRAVWPCLPVRQSWRLADNNLSLLARAREHGTDLFVAVVPLDLARDLEAALDGPVDLVTTSAFLDLVSGEWVERLAVEAAARRLPVYAALTCDERIALAPADPADAAILRAFRRHQHTDKGFGPALGPSAPAAAIGAFERVGYAVVQGRSDWVLAPHEEFQAELIAGLATAAREIGDLSAGEIAAWVTRRKDFLAAHRSSMRIGHVDFFARPIGRR